MSVLTISNIDIVDLLGVDKRDATVQLIIDISLKSFIDKFLSELNKLPGFDPKVLENYDFEDANSFAKFQSDLETRYPQIKDVIVDCTKEVKIQMFVSQIDDFEKYARATELPDFPLKHKYLGELSSLIAQLKDQVKSDQDISQAIQVYNTMKKEFNYQ